MARKILVPCFHGLVFYIYRYPNSNEFDVLFVLYVYFASPRNFTAESAVKFGTFSPLPCWPSRCLLTSIFMPNPISAVVEARQNGVYKWTSLLQPQPSMCFGHTFLTESIWKKLSVVRYIVTLHFSSLPQTGYATNKACHCGCHFRMLLLQ